MYLRKNLIKALFLAVLAGCSTDSESNDEPEIQEVRTTITDAAFEQALIDQGFDDALDGSVRTGAIDFLTDLNLDGLGIESLRGIADFQALVNLSVRNNALSSLDLRNNTNLLFVWAENNQISSIDLGTNPDFEKLGLDNNQMSSLDIAAYPKFQLLTVSNNSINSLDVSGAPDLNTLAVEGNPLNCVQVSSTQLQAIPPNWTKDETDNYAEDCN